MNKNFFTALAIAPAFCMSVYADATTDATAALTGAVSELTPVVTNAKDKELVTLIDELHTVLTNVTPNILNKLEPLTEAERMQVIGAISASQELANLMVAAESLNESKAAATIMPVMMSESPTAAANLLPYGSKMKLIDIVANLTKIAVGLGADTMAAAMAEAANACE